MNGDKLNSLQYLFSLSERHGVFRVGTGIVSSCAEAATCNDPNYIGSSFGLMTVTRSDAFIDEMVLGGIEAAKRVGRRVADAVDRAALTFRDDARLKWC
ncbi:hypothetical protein H8B02_22900 [Bradyrhizobium sp. Pear77]|uniref:hypothetical protein n=1 Tax=Bradyrhizobium altum TaxID=1571202 RepID=UPI001E43DFED|nr:hypothetical protein [Bradyrhizobium altum]MCC8956171.1 hypothetical protein [Bradyrhizobium altum]